MKYIKEDVSGYASYDDYFRYVETIRDAVGEDIYLFISDPRRHDLRSRESLHDAWIESLSVQPSAERERAGSWINKDICITLLGPYHDRLHTFSYSNVDTCLINFEFCQHGRKRDLLHHELRYENGNFEHELLFDSDMRIEIKCERINYEEKLLPAGVGTE